ncbi:Ldh family oxidoreductase [Ancylobacter amanitiformis]|uniref:(2R)-3-sulfolactate dehydrogenase (NADP+) n=1 Tax=Ancylobacter amanitiformis TaxID=217069 RepID=A0ABU0LNY7_9HYPH|nr:Ldh family oxidoreductase [Ancylobacter amanitiformis]MDQ0510417.1 (2R)-3-sulfolactate dehydrogenase (NADP+) [Ancylobacter amanitiformis]
MEALPAVPAFHDLHLSLDAARAHAAGVLAHFGTGTENARRTAEALVAAEADGLGTHGLARLPSYGAMVASGKIDGHAEPALHRVAPSVIAVDAGNGFAYPAIELGLPRLAEVARETGIAMMAIRRSSHFGVAGQPVEKLAGEGLVGLAFSNAPASIAPWGGKRAVYGTNPIAFATPLKGRPPALVDLSVAKVARGNLLAAVQRGDSSIPEGWALDCDGNPTTDAKAGLAGTMVPMGEAKGTALAFMIEVMAAALTASTFAFDAPSFFDGKGPPAAVGHVVIAIDPGVVAGDAYLDHLERLAHAIEQEPGARLPGTRRLVNRARAAREGVVLGASLQKALAGMGFPG